MTSTGETAATAYVARTLMFGVATEQGLNVDEYCDKNEPQNVLIFQPRKENVGPTQDVVVEFAQLMTQKLVDYSLQDKISVETVTLPGPVFRIRVTTT